MTISPNIHFGKITMPSLKIIRNAKHLCTVGSDDVWMFSARIWIDIWGPEISTFDVSGGSMRGPNGESELLTWGLPDQLMRSDALSLFFEEQTKSLPNGKVFDPSDLPNEIPTIELSCPPTDDQLRKLESRAHDNLGASLDISIDGRQKYLLTPDQARQYGSISIMWDEHRPDRMRISISKSSLREISNRQQGEEILCGYFPLGTQLDIRVI
jgi:hypothetical protein